MGAEELMFAVKEHVRQASTMKERVLLTQIAMVFFTNYFFHASE